MPRALMALAALAVLAAAGLGARWAWQRRPAGVFALPLRSEPAPECTFAVQLDRESQSGQVVQFGDLSCPGDPDEEAVLRVGARWFRLPSTSAGSRYGVVRRSSDNRAWVVASDADFFRSDDAGETFALLHLPEWGEDPAHALEPQISGDALEHIVFDRYLEPGRWQRLLDAFRSPGPSTVRQRWLVLSDAWDPGGFAAPLSVHVESHDGGRTWTKGGP